MSPSQLAKRFGLTIGNERPPGESISPQKKRVLIVDDNQVAADSVARLLQFMGHETAVAYDGETAVVTARSFAPEAVLLDLALPGQDGFGVAHELREMYGESVRIVALSGFDQRHFPTAFREARFDAHILKPATAEVLERVLLGKSR
jgi:DNA-binding response OmpR family regulator